MASIVEKVPLETPLIESGQGGKQGRISWQWGQWFEKLRQAIANAGGTVIYGPVTPQTTFGLPSNNGSAASASHSDHAHGTPNIAAGTGVSFSGTNPVTISNSGTLTVSVGKGLDLSGTAQNPQINAYDYETWYRTRNDFDEGPVNSNGIGYKTSGTPSKLNSNGNGVAHFTLPSTFAYIYESAGNTTDVSDWPPNGGDTTLKLSLGTWDIESFQDIDSYTANSNLIMGFVDVSFFSTGNGNFLVGGSGTGVFFRATASGHIFAVNKTGAGAGNETTFDCGAAPATGAYTSYRIVASGTSVSYYINNVLQATLTTHIPTTVLGFVSFYSDTAHTVNFYIDWVRYQRPRSTMVP